MIFGGVVVCGVDIVEMGESSTGAACPSAPQIRLSVCDRRDG
jgi:hypothetical protein